MDASVPPKEDDVTIYHRPETNQEKKVRALHGSNAKPFIDNLIKDWAQGKHVEIVLSEGQDEENPANRSEPGSVIKS